MRYSPTRAPSSNLSTTSPLLEELFVVPIDTIDTENSNFFINKDVLDSQQNDFKCLYCGKICRSRAGRVSHERKHRRDLTKEKKIKTRKANRRGIVDVYTCEICSKVFTHKASRTRHMKTHRDTIQCQICFKSFKNKMDFDWHDHDLNEETPIKRTRSKSRLSLISMNFTRSESRTNFKSRNPSRTDFSVKSLPYKIVRHDGTSNYDEISNASDFEDDDFNFDQKSSTTRRTTHSRRASPNFEFENDYFDNVFEEPIYDSRIFDETSICPESFCRRIFTNVDLLTLHEMIEHSKLALFRCVECRKRYTTSDNLAKHKAVHYHQKMIPCPLCKVLQPAKDIVTHQNKHMLNVKKCHICHLDFFDEFTYQSHFPDHFTFINNKVEILFRINSSYGNMKVDKNFDEFVGDLSFNTIFIDNIEKSSINDIKENKPWRS